MRFILILSSIILLSSCKMTKLIYPAPQEKIEVLYANHIYHPQETIKELGIKTRLRYEGRENENDFLEEEIHYDREGNIIKIIEFYERSGNGLTTTFTYNKNNKKTSRYMIPKGEPFYERDTFIYDKKGFLAELIKYSNEGEITYRQTYTYENNLLIEKYTFRSYGDIKYKYSYDNRNRIIKEESFFVKNSEYNKIEYYEYDKRNNLTFFKKTERDGTFKLSHTIKYNKNNVRIEYSASNELGKMGQFYKNKYDKNLLLTENEFFIGIKNNDLETADYLKKIYKYTYFN